MVLVQAIHHLLQLDIGWFIAVILENIHLVLMMYILIYIFMGGKRTFYAFVILSINVWAWIALCDIAGVFLLVGGFLFLMYLGKLTLFMFIEGNEKLMKRATLLNEFQGITFLILFNLYMVFMLGMVA